MERDHSIDNMALTVFGGPSSVGGDMDIIHWSWHHPDPAEGAVKPHVESTAAATTTKVTLEIQLQTVAWHVSVIISDDRRTNVFSEVQRLLFSDVFFLHLTVLLLTRSQGEDLLMATDRQCTYIDWLTPRVTACRRLQWRERVIRDKSCNVVIGLQPQLLKKKGRNKKKRKLM